MRKLVAEAVRLSRETLTRARGDLRGEKVNGGRPSFRRIVPLLGGMVAFASLGGCLVYDVVSVPVKVAVGTAEVAGDVAIGAAKVTGSLVGATLKTVASLAQAGTVTLVDLTTDKVTRVPWREGLTLAGAGDAAKVRVAQRAVDVVRGGKVIYSAAKTPDPSAPVAAGDVVRLGP